MIAYEDFVPEVVSHPGFFRREEVEDFAGLVERLNAWLDEQGSAIDVVNVETVVLPNIFRDQETGSGDTWLTAAGTSDSWHQVLRLWYRVR